MNTSISQALKYATRLMAEAGVPDARREAGSLLAHAICASRTFLITNSSDEITQEQFNDFETLVERRAAGEPLQYIVGAQDFFGRTFAVTPAVLIPRPETEILVEAALGLIPVNGPVQVCDVGTGSGCIAITLLCERENARCIALDVSTDAIKIAAQNARTHFVENRIEFVESDCFDRLSLANGPLDLIVSNPPYVSGGVVAGLQREVRDHEPLVALSPGPDGLSIIRRLITESPRYLKPDGYLLMEIGYDQGETVSSLIDSATWDMVELIPDLQGIPRILVLRKQSQ